MPESAMSPPEGMTSNFEDPENTVYIASIVTQTLCISIVGILVALRIFIRIHILHNFQLEDWLLVVGFILAIGYSATALVMNHYGGGIDAWNVEKEKIVPFGITVYTTMVLYGPCAFAIKASILVFLARVFSPIKRAVLIIRILLAGLLAYYLPVLFLKAAICRPVSKFWMPALEGQCFDQRALILADSVVSVVSDMVIFAIPVPLTCNLHMQKKKRVKIAAVFSAGGLACVCSAIRLIDIVKDGLSPNQTLVFMRVNLWGIAEVYIGLITACMPVFPALWKKYFGSSNSGHPSYPRFHDSSTQRSIEMLSSKRKRATITKQNSEDCGSDENVLITDVLGHGSNSHPTSNHTDVSQKDRSSSPTSYTLEDGTQITKTVEIKQTFE